ncbi:MAG: PorT family protein [Maribacter sp.]|nr:PorT family protein [Maribacter sp.]
MKKLLFFTAIVLFGFTYVSAQEIDFGAKAGVNFATITGDDLDSFSSRTAFHLGFVAEIGITETFSFQPELLYSAQGADYSEDGFEGSVKVDYLNLPLMAKFYVAEGFSLEAGPQVGFLLSAKDAYDGGEDDWSDITKGIDFGLNFGIGYKLQSGLNFGARYNLGLSDLNDDPDSQADSAFKNSVIQAYVGFFF